MEYVPFGNTGMEVSRLCVGAMMFGPKLDEAGSRQVVDEALEQGVNFIDTAESYGQSEEFLGRILEGRREELYLATKVHRKRAKEGRAGRNSRSNILYSLERSLRLLKTDYIDLYMIHHPDPETPIQETMATLQQVIEQGKARYIGVANHYAWQMAHMLGLANQHGWEPIVSIQCSQSILDRVIERETIPFCERFNMATMIYGPLSGGILSGKYHRDEAAPEGSRGAGNRKVRQQLDDPHTFDTLEELTTIADGIGVSLPQLAVMWLLSKPFVTTLLMGGSKPEHYQVLYEVADRRLNEDEVARIDEISESWKYGPYVNQPRSQGAALAAQW